jgi:hypothetical protein
MLFILATETDNDTCVVYRRLVSGAGDIKLTKDGNVLLHEMVRTG